jgi:hypothetical protein
MKDKKATTMKASYFSDPWKSLSSDYNYEVFADGEIDANATMKDLRDAFFDLMEEEDLDELAQEAYHRLDVVGHRLAVDAFLYDEQAAEELVGWLAKSKNRPSEVKPLCEQIPFAWDF